MGGRVGSPTDSQRKFVERYLAHGNARRAAREAGYPERRGAAMLTTRVVGDMVRSAQQKAAQRSTMNRDEALDRASDIARKGQDKDAINALKLLAALCGWEAAKKHELSGPNGQPIAITQATRADAVAALRLELQRNPKLRDELLLPEETK